MSSAATNVLAFIVPAEKRQAEYFRALLKQQWAQVAEQIATDHAALVRHHDGGNQARRILRRIAKQRQEQFELEQLLAQLERRFFGRAATPASTAAPARCFEVSVNRPSTTAAAGDSADAATRSVASANRSAAATDRSAWAVATAVTDLVWRHFTYEPTADAAATAALPTAAQSAMLTGSPLVRAVMELADGASGGAVDIAARAVDPD